ncbi:MAG: GH3 family domain-containing protein, partial [Bacteroidia bacterium]
MIAPVISWYFRQRHDELWSLVSKAEEQQILLLQQLSDKLSLTQYGESLGVKESLSYADFKRLVPVVEYEDLQPYIERNMKGEQQLLWPGDVTWFAKSSGTTSNSAKFIPISYESLEYSHYMGGREALTQYLSFRPESRLFEGKGLLVGGSHQVNQLSDRSYYGDLSAVLMNHLPVWANWKSTPEMSIALMENWEEKLEAMAQSVAHENVTSMSGVPTWTL